MAAGSAEHDATTQAEPTSPGGWKRVVLGLLVGLIAGAIVALLLPRDATDDHDQTPELPARGGIAPGTSDDPAAAPPRR